MPNIRGIDLSDGIQILRPNWTAGNDPKYSRADIEAYLAGHDIDKTEQQANTWLESHFDDVSIRVHIFSASPLSYTCGVWEKGAAIPDNWWGE